MTYVGDEARLEQLRQKAIRPSYTADGKITPSLTWEDQLEIEAIEERRPSHPSTVSEPEGGS